jgi:hypothetical protein
MTKNYTTQSRTVQAVFTQIFTAFTNVYERYSNRKPSNFQVQIDEPGRAISGAVMG